MGRLPGVSFAPIAPYGQPNYWLTVARFCPERFESTCEEVRLALEEQNIESRRVWVPLHLQKSFAGCRYRGGQVAEEIYADSLCLPSGSALTDAELDRIASLIEQVAQTRPTQTRPA